MDFGGNGNGNGNSGSHSSNLPLAQQQQQQRQQEQQQQRQQQANSSGYYVYNGHFGQARPENGTASASVVSASPMMPAQMSVPGAPMGVRPISMYDRPTPKIYSVLSGNAQQQQHQQHQHQQQQQTYAASGAPSADGSFHAIMIGDNPQMAAALSTAGHPVATVSFASGSSKSHAQAIPLRPKQSFDATGNNTGLADVYGGSLSASLPSGNPFLHAALSVSAANNSSSSTQHGTALNAGYPNKVMYPALGSGYNSGADWSPALNPPDHGPRYGLPEQTRQSQSSNPHTFSSAPQTANVDGSNVFSQQLYSYGRQSQAMQKSPGLFQGSHQSVSMADIKQQSIASSNTDMGSSAQLYPVSQPGLPPAATASIAGHSSYAVSSNQSSLSARGRSRRKPHQTYEYPETSITGTYSSGSSPAPGSTQAFALRQSMSSAVVTDSVSDTAAPENAQVAREGSDYNMSMNSVHGSSSSDLSALANYSPGSAAKYNYPELSYKPVNAARASTGTSTSPPNSGQELYPDSSLAEQVKRLDASYDGMSYPDYANTASSMAHVRWTPAAGGSPLRSELGSTDVNAASGSTHIAQLPEGLSARLPSVSQSATIRSPGVSGFGSETSAQQQQQQMAQLYATLPRAAAYNGSPQTSAGSATRGKIPAALSTKTLVSSGGSSVGASLQASRPPPSPHIGAGPIGAYGHQRNDSYTLQQSQQPSQVDSASELQTSTPSILKDYYMVSSPADRSYAEPTVSRPDSTSILPMVEVNHSGTRPVASNIDDFNAHSQEYLHRRRRRLTQTMHNRQRSGSAVDASARLSVAASSRTNAMPISSPGTNSLASNRSMEDGLTQQGSEADSSGNQLTYHQQPPIASVYQQAIPQQQLQPQQQQQVLSSSYTSASSGYLAADSQGLLFLQAQAQAQAQTEYMQRLQHERLRQERLQQERLQQEQMHLALEQQRLKLKLAQEQEVARFRNYRPLLSLTVDIVDTYRKCHSEFYYESARRPRRVLTHPSEGVKNDGFDNQNSDYILYVNDIIGDKDGHQYLILEMLGSGTFGQVVKCQNIKTGDFFAVKVIKNKSAYYNQSMMEVQMLDLLNKKYDVDDKHHILRLKEWFVFRHHLVFVNELLSINLYDLLKQNQYQGLSTNLVRVLVQQILDAMIVLNRAQIIHADLKPENILLEGMEKPVVKVIDFGSACFEWQTMFTYIQSRFYRSPEILLGLPYSSRIDMWSLGCIVAELYLGLPLFPGTSEYNQLSRIVDLLGLPPNNMLEKARRTDEFFNYLGPGTWDLKSMAQYARERNVEEKQSKRYFTANTLEELITSYPIRRKMSEAEQQREYQSRIALVDFLRGLLHLDPGKRWSPQQAIMHPFITGEPFNMPYAPSKRVSGGIHGSGSASGPYGGNAPGSGGNGSGSGGYSNPGSSGYQSQGAGDNGNGGGGFSSMGMSVGRSAGYQALVAGLSDANNGLGAAVYDNDPGIPGSFPMKDASNAQSRESSYSGSRSSRVDYSNATTSRLRATTGGYSLSNTTGTANGIMSLASQQYAYANQQQQQQQQQQQRQNDFLDVDPCTSLINELLAADGNSFDGPGRSRVSLGSSEYSAESGFGWAILSDANSSNISNSNNNIINGGSRSNTGAGASNPLSLAGSFNTRASSIYDYKIPTSTVTAPSTASGIPSLIAAVAAASTAIPQQQQQQQRTLQRRYPQHGEFGSEYSYHHPSSDGYESSDLVTLPRVGGGNFSQGGTLVGSKSKASINRSSCQSAISSDISLQNTPGPLAGTVASALMGSAAASSANFISISMTDSSAASSVVGGNCLSGGFSSMRIRPLPAPRINGGARLVSNFSPLTLPSSPGSSNLGLHRADSMAVTDDFYEGNESGIQANREEEDSDYSEYGDIEEYLEYGDADGDDNANADNDDAGEDGSDISGSRYSEGSALSRPMTQITESEKSLSMYSAISDNSDDGKHGHSLQDEAEQEEDAETDDNDYDDIKDDIDSH
ncbi:dual specificity protein kinase yak1, partial [Coemansia asiatica]